MPTGALRKGALALTFWLALHATALRAQTFTAPLKASTTGTNPVDFEFRADGTMIAKGNLGVGSLLSTDQGAGTRLLWFPDLAAFRAGNVTNTQWNAANIGQYSLAFNHNTTASGLGSIALGYYATASGANAKSLGAYSTASGAYSTALGLSSIASGESSAALGPWTTANGTYSLSLGVGSTSSGEFSTAMGWNTTAGGNASTASGLYTHADAYDSYVLGTYNLGGGSATTWVAGDPLFEIGNGTATAPKDALLLDKSGNLTVKTVTVTAAAGDIPMYMGN